MEYNTSREKLTLPEYGRNILMMVEHAKAIEDHDERNRAAQTIISIMGNMNPHLRDINDFKHKLWDHLALMADFDMNIESPYPIPAKEYFQSKPGNVSYGQHRIKYRHYGFILQDLINKAAAYEDGEEKDALVRVIANHMKKAYLMWNKDSVSDEAIFKNIAELSGGKIKVKEGLRLSDSKDMFKAKRKRTVGRKEHSHSDKNTNRKRHQN